MPETAENQPVLNDDEPQQDAPEEPTGHEQGDAGAQEGIHPLRPEVMAGGARAADRPPGSRWDNLARMLDVPLTLTVELGSTDMQLSEVLRLETGSIITINRLPGEPIDLLVNGRVFARGEVVVINETFGYRITELVDDAEQTIQIAGMEEEQR